MQGYLAEQASHAATALSEVRQELRDATTRSEAGLDQAKEAMDARVSGGQRERDPRRVRV